MRQPSPLGRADAVLGGYRSTEIPDESIDDRLDIILGLFGKPLQWVTMCMLPSPK